MQEGEQYVHMQALRARAGYSTALLRIWAELPRGRHRHEVQAPDSLRGQRDVVPAAGAVVQRCDGRPLSVQPRRSGQQLLTEWPAADDGERDSDEGIGVLRRVWQLAGELWPR